MNKQEQLDRILQYSEMLNEGEKVVSDLQRAIENFIAFKDKKVAIDKYYQSHDRVNDLKLEAKHEIPEGMNHGILGEDYAWDFLFCYEHLEKLLEIKTKK